MASEYSVHGHLAPLVQGMAEQSSHWLQSEEQCQRERGQGPYTIPKIMSP